MNTAFDALVQAVLDILKRKYSNDHEEMRLRRTKYWDLIDEIKTERTAAIRLAKSKLSSSIAYERFFGISILGQVCNPVEEGEEDEAEQIIAWLSDLAKTETAVACLSCIANALGYSFSKSAEPALLTLSRHENNDIRWAATVSLGSVTAYDVSEAATVRLLELSTDKDPDIRDWATAWLGGLDEDNERIRNALVVRLKDRHFETRTEAIRGLAVRGDLRGIEPLKKRLAGDKVHKKDIESAGIYGLPELQSYLQDWESFGYLTEWAGKRCDPDPAIKDSVDDKWSNDETYLMVKNGKRRPIKYKEWDGEGSPWKD